MSGWDGDTLGAATRRDWKHPVGREVADADVLLARAVEGARHTAMVEAGRGATMVNPEDGAQQAGATHPDAYGRLLREAARLRDERAALRAAVARLEGERDQASAARDLADAILAEVMAQRDRLASELLAAEAERDAARAALDGLIQDVEYFSEIQHRMAHSAHTHWDGCQRDGCPGLRRAVARARAATGGGADAPRCPESGGEGGS